MAGYQIPGWGTINQPGRPNINGANSASHSSTTPLNTGFSQAMIQNIQPLLSPGAQDGLANQQWGVARDNAMSQIGSENQHLAEQWAARSGRSLNGGGGIGVQAELAKTRLDPALAAIEQNRIGQQMTQRNMLAGFAPALLAMNQRQSEFQYQQSQDAKNRADAEAARQRAAAEHARQQMAGNSAFDSTYGLFNQGGGGGTAPGGGGGGGMMGGPGGEDKGFGKLGSERGLWNAPKTSFGVTTSATPSAIKGNAFNAASQGLSVAANAMRKGLQ